MDDDWKFEDIEDDAWRRVGHQYEGRQHSSVGEVVVKAIHDLEAAFALVHPGATCEAVAAFWTSCQVHRHVSDFCARLAESETGRLLAGSSFDAGEEAERARVHLCRQLVTFAHELSSCRMGVESAKRRGYRPEIKAFMRKNSLRTNEAAARRLGIGVDTLKSIMSSKGTPRYSKETLNKVLETIGFKEH